MKEFKSFLKTVGGNEGSKCHYGTRLDTYGCGCQHDCSYCYAKSLLDFRGLWDASEPRVANIKAIEKAVKKLDGNVPVRLGGMTDCFMPQEAKHGVTYETLKLLNEHRMPYLIVTKGSLIGTQHYIDVLDKELAHIQISVTCNDDDLYRRLRFENASLPSERISCAEKLSALGYDVQIRLSPFIPEFIDFGKLSEIKCDKLLVEFLRVNSWVKKWFDIDISEYTVKQGGYYHLPLEAKKRYLSMIKGFNRITVCDDEDEAYDYFKNNFNPNPEDCCDLRKQAV